MNISSNLKTAIIATWNQLEEAAAMCEGNNEIAMEFVLDADRMEFAGFPAENAEVRDLVKQHTFAKVRKELAGQIELL